MKRKLKKYFIPHEENEFRPHILRESAVTALTVIAIAVFVFSSAHTRILLNNFEFLAAVLPNVLVDLTNDDRIDNNFTPLTINTTLEKAAQLKADHMAEGEYFAHVSPDGVTPWHWFIEAGYDFVAAGENLAVNFSDSADVEQAWLDSPGHRTNLLNGDFTEIGIATSQGRYKGQDTIFVVQLFGRPAIASEVPVPVAVAETPSEGEVLPEVEDLSLAVHDTSSEEVGEQELAGSEAVGLLAPEESNFIERLFTQPRTLAQSLYIILGLFVLVALIVNIVIEIKHQHPKHIAYGVLLLVLILELAFYYRNFIFADLLII